MKPIAYIKRSHSHATKNGEFLYVVMRGEVAEPEWRAFPEGRIMPVYGRAFAGPSLEIPIHQAVVWASAIGCAERDPFKDVVIPGKTVIAINAALSRVSPARLEQFEDARERMWEGREE
jgi:hypothetical protein